MGFGREVPEAGLPEGYAGAGWHLVSKVLPMGFVNSVAIAQHVHRRVIQQALGGERQLAGAQQEIRRDRHQSTARHLCLDLLRDLLLRVTGQSKLLVSFSHCQRPSRWGAFQCLSQPPVNLVHLIVVI